MICVKYMDKYIADKGKVFDWKDLDEHTALEYDENDNETGNIIQEHCYLNELILDPSDSIDNYVEVDMPEELEI